MSSWKRTFRLPSALAMLSAAPFLLLSLTGCGSEKAVTITLITQPREGQQVTDEYVELQEGHAIGVRVEALQNGEVRENWSIDLRAENSAVVGVFPGVEENVFVLSGATAGTTDLHFVLDGRHDVLVDARVVARQDWEPSVPPLNLGGSGSR